MNVSSPPPRTATSGSCAATAGGSPFVISNAAATGEASSSAASPAAPLGSDQRVLRDIGRLARKAGCAVCEVEAPAAHEALAEALCAHRIGTSIERGEPSAKRLGV